MNSKPVKSRSQVAVVILVHFPGRDPETSYLQLDKAGVEVDQNTKKIIVDENERTSVPNIFGIGDVIHVCLYSSYRFTSVTDGNSVPV